MLKNTDIKVATVVNFPLGNKPLAEVLQETEDHIESGADEIDMVIPYQDYLSGNRRSTSEMITACRKLCDSNIVLKVILETGILAKPELITAASKDAITAGADFLKTSTGKAPINATLKAAELMLTAIKNSGKNAAGFKAAGGIKTYEQAMEYLQLADNIMGENWVSPKTFRFGASSLLQNLNTHLTY